MQHLNYSFSSRKSDDSGVCVGALNTPLRDKPFPIQPSIPNSQAPHSSNALSVDKKGQNHTHICMYMVCTWCVHGVYMVCTWCVHGVHMVCTWCVHGVCMVCTWCAHRVCMVCTWCAHGVHLVCAHGVHGVCTWCVHSVCMVCTWCVHGVYMVRTWCAHVVHMVCTWCVHGVYILCAHGVCTWCVHGTEKSYNNHFHWVSTITANFVAKPLPYPLLRALFSRASLPARQECSKHSKALAMPSIEIPDSQGLLASAPGLTPRGQITAGHGG